MGGRIEQAGELRSARVESLRALAALGVLAGHAVLVAAATERTPDALVHRLVLGGLLGVFLFFALTGYLLYLPFVRGGVNLRRYALNRALRILPLYWAVVAILYAAKPSGAQAADWWRFALFLQNYSADTISRLDSPMWSLVVEVQFYLLLPLLALGLAAVARGSLARAAAVVGLLALASFALRLDRVLLGDEAVTSPIGRFALPTVFFFFTSGMLLALLRVHLDRTGRTAAGSPSAWIAAGAALWLVAANEPTWEPVVWAASFLTLGGCVLPLRGSAVLARALEWRPLAAIGTASYSLYLWHLPVLLVLAGQSIAITAGGVQRFSGDPWPMAKLIVLGAAVSVAVAAVSYLVVERPFLRLRRRWAPRGRVEPWMTSPSSTPPPRPSSSDAATSPRPS
ncbi:MAG: acyltransferase [Actinomycetota bacterium]|nr:acyltransferase [Actinomycetota bacterium]